jgi:hypothetical protein
MTASKFDKVKILNKIKTVFNIEAIYEDEH